MFLVPNHYPKYIVWSVLEGRLRHKLLFFFFPAKSSPENSISTIRACHHRRTDIYSMTYRNLSILGFILQVRENWPKSCLIQSLSQKDTPLISLVYCQIIIFSLAGTVFNVFVWFVTHILTNPVMYFSKLSFNFLLGYFK